MVRCALSNSNLQIKIEMNNLKFENPLNFFRSSFFPRKIRVFYLLYVRAMTLCVTVTQRRRVLHMTSSTADFRVGMINESTVGDIDSADDRDEDVQHAWNIWIN